MKLKVAILSGLIVGASIASVTIAAQKAKSQWDGVYTEAQAHRGESLYAEHCAICHGPDLLGGEMAPPLIGGAFQSNWNELSLGDLFERIRTSMPQSAPGSLGRQAYADILSYMLAKGSYPAGSTELPTQTDALQGTQFLAAKP